MYYGGVFFHEGAFRRVHEPELVFISSSQTKVTFYEPLLSLSNIIPKFHNEVLLRIPTSSRQLRTKKKNSKSSTNTNVYK